MPRVPALGANGYRVYKSALHGAEPVRDRLFDTVSGVYGAKKIASIAEFATSRTKPRQIQPFFDEPNGVIRVLTGKRGQGAWERRRAFRRNPAALSRPVRH